MDVKSTGISLVLSWVKYSYYYFIIFGGKISKMRISILISSIAFLFLLSCQTNSTKEITSEVTIKGTITNPIGDVAFFKTKDTSFEASVDSLGVFSITFSIDSAMYLDFKNGPERTAMYVHPGDKISMTIDTKMYDETISYKGSPKSSYLAKKYLLREQMDFMGEVFYFGTQDEYVAYLNGYRDSIMSDLNTFDDSLFTSTEIEDMNKMLDYYAKRQESLVDLSPSSRKYRWEADKASMNYNFYVELISMSSLEYDSMLSNYAAEMNSLLATVDDTAFVSKTKKGISSTVKAWKERKHAKENVPKPGEMAIGFTYPNKDSVEFSLADFSGKLVYVDVWATWCGPCKAEIPSLQKLEGEYHDKNITFLSVSVDEDRQAWVDMVINDQLGGVQLWADGWSQITKDYAIFGIPRFMLFDQDGKVISTDAPRPSSAEIRPLIEEYI